MTEIFLAFVAHPGHTAAAHAADHGILAVGAVGMAVYLTMRLLARFVR